MTLSQPIDSCSTVLMWSTPSSDRPITSYSVYRDGVSIEPNLSSTTTQYTDSDQIDVTAVHTYYVVASSCAGDNTSNVVSSVSIGGECVFVERGNLFMLCVDSIILVPSSPLVTLSQTDISCSNTLISWPTPSSYNLTLIVWYILSRCTTATHRNDVYPISCSGTPAEWLVIAVHSAVH